MMDDTLVCNSQGITIFDEIIHSPDVTWRAIEIAGHGIAASALHPLHNEAGAFIKIT